MSSIQRILYVAKIPFSRNVFVRQCINRAIPCSNVLIQRYTATQEVRSIHQSENFLKRLVKKLPFVNISKNKLKVTGYILYETIADAINYPEMFAKLNMPDSFYSWFVITELHIWMLMVRYMAEGEEGREVRNAILQALWTDCNHRAKKLGSISSSAVRTQIFELSEQLQAAIIAYDEGLQSNDVVLAGALWRRLYQEDIVDPEHLDALVKYIRRQVKLLDAMTTYELFEEKNIKWEPFKI